VLLIVTALIAAGGILVALAVNQSFRGLKRWDQEKNRLQAFYLAESGIACQLVLEKSIHDSSDASDSLIFQVTLLDAEESEPDPYLEHLGFKLNPDLPLPEFSSSREGAWLDISSTATFKTARCGIKARFGRSLDDPVFSSALVLAGNHPLAPRAFDRINGPVRVKKTQTHPEENEYPLEKKFNTGNLIGPFAVNKGDFFDSELNENLSREGGPSGNGYFNSNNIPDFSQTPDVFFPLGDITIEHYSSSRLNITGPGSFYAHGDIYVKGNIHFEDIRLLAGRSIYFEDMVSSRNLTAYAARSISIHDKSNLDVQAVARENILMDGTSQTSLASFVLSIGFQSPAGASFGGDRRQSPGKQQTPAPGSMYGILLKEEARARGLFVAAGRNGSLKMISPDNVLEGIAIVMNQTRLAGMVKGLVITNSLRCNDSSNENCIGEGEIDRSLMPARMSLPLDFGTGNRSEWKFKLIDWRMVD
jgi:hypothetical protein